MNTYKLTPEERFNLIMECRSSGLTDYQWCREKGISTSTFYRWISLFRENGFPNVPEPLHQKDSHKAAKQEVVKLSLVSESIAPAACDICDSLMKQNTLISDTVTTGFSPVAEISGNGITLRISNDINPEIAGMLLRHLRGAI